MFNNFCQFKANLLASQCVNIFSTQLRQLLHRKGIKKARLVLKRDGLILKMTFLERTHHVIQTVIPMTIGK